MDINSLPSYLLPIWFGIFTSISPCPLATNITAMSYISSGKNKKESLLYGVMYSLGRVFVYLVLTIIIVNFTDKISSIAMFLQTEFMLFLGVILIVIGAVVSDLLPISIKKFQFSSTVLEKVSKIKYTGPFLLGALFALSFCPISAGLFFGNVTSMVLSKEVPIVVGATMYGVGTAIPVLFSALILVFAREKIGSFFNKITKFEKISRIAIALLFIGSGIYIIAFK